MCPTHVANSFYFDFKKDTEDYTFSISAWKGFLHNAGYIEALHNGNIVKLIVLGVVNLKKCVFTIIVPNKQ